MSLRLGRIAGAFFWVAAGAVAMSGVLPGQAPAPRPTEPKPNLSTDPVLHSFQFRSIGPAVMMGRLDDIQGTEKDPMLLYIGFATGGLWKSTDGGEPLALAVRQHGERVDRGDRDCAFGPRTWCMWGRARRITGRARRSAMGFGGQQTGARRGTHLGLEKVQSINRIAVDPLNPKIAFVATPGHLFGPNPDRGLYRTMDGGKTWKNVKFIDENTGFNDVAIDPSNPKIVYASSFERRRNGWGYNGGGPNGGLWKSVDGGNTWVKLDGPGWPKPKDGLYGRIAIAIFKAKPTTIYAQVEAGASAGTGGGTLANGLQEPPGRNPFGEAPAEGAPAAAGAPAGGQAAAAGGAPPAQGGRPAPPPPDPNGNGVYRSDDGGKTWVFVSNQNQRPTYFSQIRVDPKNVNKLFVGGTPGQMSLDGGKTWKGLTGSHTDYHAIWINPADTRIVAVGHDGGLDISNDGGFTWDYHNDIAVGQFYQVSADMRHPYHVCGGLQDNNAWCAPSALRSTIGPVNTDWYTVAGGDGFYTRQDPLDWGIIYAESQDGNMSRHNLHDATQKSIKPTVATPPAARAAGETPLPGAGAAPANENPVPANPVATNPTAGSAPAEAAVAAGTAAPAGGGRRGGRGAQAGGAAAAAATPAAENPFGAGYAERHQRAEGHWAVPVLLECAVRGQPARSLGGVHGGAVLLQKHQPRRFLDDESDGPDEEPAALVGGSSDHGGSGRQADGGQA